MNDKCICIPARYLSTRLPGKLLYKLGEKTCIQRTIEGCLPLGLPIFVLTDANEIKEHIEETFLNDQDQDNALLITVFLTSKPCKNGTDRICKHLYKIPEQYTTIINVQADEPFIDTNNIKHAIDMFQTIKNDNLHFYTTLHQPFKIVNTSDELYLKNTASLTVTTTNSNRVMTYTRGIVPWNKNGTVNTKREYKLFTGIYVFHRDMLRLYNTLDDTDLQMEEDIEQLKILENDYHVYSFPAIRFNEISLNCQEDLDLLCSKYDIRYTPHPHTLTPHPHTRINKK